MPKLGCDGGNDYGGPKVSPILKAWVPTTVFPGPQIGFAHLSHLNVTTILTPKKSIQTSFILFDLKRRTNSLSWPNTIPYTLYYLDQS